VNTSHAGKKTPKTIAKKIPLNKSFSCWNGGGRLCELGGFIKGFAINSPEYGTAEHKLQSRAAGKSPKTSPSNFPAKETELPVFATPVSRTHQLAFVFSSQQNAQSITQILIALFLALCNAKKNIVIQQSFASNHKMLLARKE
jgi:hypothetical protein